MNTGSRSHIGKSGNEDLLGVTGNSKSKIKGKSQFIPDFMKGKFMHPAR